MKCARGIIIWVVVTSTLVCSEVPVDRATAPASGIPKEIKAQLDAVGCTLTTAQEGMYISGEFAAEGQKDWAFLCPKTTEKYSIVILWGGAAHCPEIQETFSRVPLRKLTPDQIMRMPEEWRSSEKSIGLTLQTRISWTSLNNGLSFLPIRRHRSVFDVTSRPETSATFSGACGMPSSLMR